MESIVQNGRLVITRRFNESFIIRPDAKVRSLLPVEVLFRTPIIVTLLEGDGDGQFQVCVEADKRLNIVRSELVNKAELDERTSLLYRDDIDLVDHQHSLKDELQHVDNERRGLKERITEEGEAAKRERRNADRKKINRWKRRDEELLAYRTEIRNKLGDLKEAIKQRNITENTQGRGAGKAVHDVFANAFMEVAQAMLSETQYHQILQMAEGREKGNS